MVEAELSMMAGGYPDDGCVYMEILWSSGLSRLYACLALSRPTAYASSRSYVPSESRRHSGHEQRDLLTKLGRQPTVYCRLLEWRDQQKWSDDRGK